MKSPTQIVSSFPLVKRFTGAVLVLMLLNGSPASAATRTWLGNSSNLWDAGANWVGGTAPVNGDSLVFGAPGASGLSVSDNIASLTLGGAGTDGITFDTAAGIYTLARTGTLLTLSSSAGGIGIKDLSLFLQTISAPITYAGAQTIQVGGTSGASLSSLTLSGAQSGGYRLTKTGNGLLSLTTSNTLGGLTINAGTVNISVDSQLSAAPASASAGWLVLNDGALRTNVNTSWTLNANRGISLGDGTAGSGGTISTVSTSAATANTLTLTYNGVIANNGGTNSLIKTGIQILSLGGSNTYTGATKINQGQLTLDFSGTAAPTSNIINSSSVLVMGGLPTALSNSATVGGNPILLVQGSGTGSRSQSFSSTTITQGYSSILARSGSSASNSTISLGTISHTAGATVGFSLLSGGSSGVGIITTTSTNTNGILGGWATTAGASVSGTVARTQTDWAMVDGSNNIVAYTGYTTPTGATPTLASNAANNVRVDSTSTGNVGLTFSSNISELNTILVSDTVARTIATGSGNTLRLGSYGGIWKSGAGTLTIGAATSTGGALTAGGAANTDGEIVLNTSGAQITVNSAITNNGTGVVSLTKIGTNTLTLANNNTLTGGIFVNAGTVAATNAGAFGGAGADVTVMPGATIQLSALTYANNFRMAGSMNLGLGSTITGTITLIGDSTFGTSGTSAYNTLGFITGNYNAAFVGSVALSSTANNYTGSSLLNGAGASSPMTLKLLSSEVLPNGVGMGNVNISGATGAGSFTTLDLNGKTETINGLTSSGTLNQARVSNNAGGTATLILGDNDQTASFAGVIVDGTGSVAITKIGVGVQTFTGSNSYTGATKIENGTLAIGLSSSISNSVTLGKSGATNGTLDLTAKGSYSIANLAGNGTVNVGTGNTFTATGAVAPGFSAGGLSVTGNFTLASTAAIAMEIAGSTAGAFDLVSTTGTFTYGGSLSIAAIDGYNLQQNGLYKLFSAGTVSESADFTSITVGGVTLLKNAGVWSGSDLFANYSFANSTGELSITAVPEPGTGAMVAGGAALLLFLRRQRRRI